MRGLFRRYVITLASLVSVSVLAVGLALALYHRAQDQRRAHEVQTAEARAVAASINAYLRGIESALRALAQRLPAGLAASRDAQARDFRDALKFQPAILNIRSLDRQFRETNFVSRIEPDRVGSGMHMESLQQMVAQCTTPICYGSVFVRDQTEPYVSIALKSRQDESLAAEISVRFIDELLASLSPRQSGRAYVVDLSGQLLAHPDLRTLLRRADVSRLRQVQDVRAALRQGLADLPSAWGESPDGGAVFASASRIQGSDWLLYVEQPAAEVLRTVRTTIGVTILVLAFGVAAASVAALLLARRLARPVLQLRDGAQRLGGGDLSATFDIQSGDEIQSVAIAFNGMADSLRTLYESLESKVIERTQDLALANRRITDQAAQLSLLNQQLQLQLEQLKDKRAAAERANAAKTRFVAAASHDLRQPMHAVGLLVGILAERQLSPEVHSLLTKIQWSVAALETLFETLLDISRLDAGIVAPHEASLSVESLFRSVALTHAQAALDKGLTLRMHGLRTLIQTDQALLLSMLNNLVSNAIRYTAKGRVDVFCRKDRRFVTLCVADTGIGIPAHELERVFEDFYQLAGARRAHGEGLGLGLAIVKRTAELMGYPLSVRSAVGAGSVFGIRIPVSSPAQFRQTTPGAECAPQSVLAGAFIVIVDDDQESRFATEALFKSWHCHVIAGAGGEAVREALAHHLRQPDLIVADYWLSDGETGLHFIQALRCEAEILIPAIILTAEHDTGLAAPAMNRNVAYLQKPANAQRIRRTALDLLPAATERHQVTTLD